MNANAKPRILTSDGSRFEGAEQRLELGVKLPRPFGTYVEAVQTGNLFFLPGCFP